MCIVSNEQIKLNIQKRLKEKELSIRQLSFILDTAYSSVYKQVKGPSKITMQTISKIANALDIDPIKLMTQGSPPDK